MKKKEQELLLIYLQNKKFPFDKAFTPTKYSYRVGYNQAIHDVSLHIKNQRIKTSEAVQE